jgi:hypothetical protein
VEQSRPHPIQTTQKVKKFNLHHLIEFPKTPEILRLEKYAQDLKDALKSPNIAKEERAEIEAELVHAYVGHHEETQKQSPAQKLGAEGAQKSAGQKFFGKAKTIQKNSWQKFDSEGETGQKPKSRGEGKRILNDACNLFQELPRILGFHECGSH